MFEFIIDVFTILSKCFCCLFWTSYTIGKLISWILQSIYSIFSSIFFGIMEVGCVFSDDFIIFLKDFTEISSNVINAGTDSITTSFMFLYSLLKIIIENIANGNLYMVNVGCQISDSFAAMMLAIRNLFILIGNGCFLILSIIPTTIFAAVNLLECAIVVCIPRIQSFWTCCTDVTWSSINYFIDIPLKAVIGCCFLLTIIINRWIVMKIVLFLAQKTWEFLRPRHIVFRIPFFQSIFGRSHRNESRRNYVRSTKNTTNNSGIDNEYVCVVCRDEEKNVVLWPCRHLCLCISCARLVASCPLCRQPIHKAISVFT